MRYWARVMRDTVVRFFFLHFFLLKSEHSLVDAIGLALGLALGLAVGIALGLTLGAFVDDCSLRVLDFTICALTNWALACGTSSAAVIDVAAECTIKRSAAKNVLRKIMMMVR